MTGRLASGRAGLRMWARRGLMLALPLPLLAFAAAAFALAPSGVSHRAGARPNQGLFPPLPRASVPAQAIDGRFAVPEAAVSVGGHALPRPPRAGRRRRVTQSER
jgi:hypothetical protein